MDTQTRYNGHGVIKDLTVFEKGGIATTMVAEVEYGNNFSGKYIAEIRDDVVDVYVNNAWVNYLTIDSFYCPPFCHTAEQNADVLYTGIVNEINHFIEKNLNLDTPTLTYSFHHYKSLAEQEIWKEAIERAKENFSEAYDVEEWEELDKYQREDCVHFEYKKLCEEKQLGTVNIIPEQTKSKNKKSEIERD